MRILCRFLSYWPGFSPHSRLRISLVSRETGAKRSKHSILSHSTLLLLPEWMVDIVRLVPSPDFRKLLKHHDASQDRAEALLDSKLEAQKLGLEPDDDLFEIMCKWLLRAVYGLLVNETLIDKAHSGSPDDISTEEIKDQFGTITVAGEDTTVSLMISRVPFLLIFMTCGRPGKRNYLGTLYTSNASSVATTLTRGSHGCLRKLRKRVQSELLRLLAVFECAHQGSYLCDEIISKRHWLYVARKQCDCTARYLTQNALQSRIRWFHCLSQLYPGLEKRSQKSLWRKASMWK